MITERLGFFLTLCTVVFNVHQRGKPRKLVALVNVGFMPCPANAGLAKGLAFFASNGFVAWPPLCLAFRGVDFAGRDRFCATPRGAISLLRMCSFAMQVLQGSFAYHRSQVFVKQISWVSPKQLSQLSRTQSPP